MNEFNSLLKKYVSATKKTIYLLAKETETDRTTLSKEIKGTRFIPKDVFLKLIEVLNLSVSQKQRLIELYNEMALGPQNYSTFKMILNNFAKFSDILLIKSNKDFYLDNSLDNLNFVPKYSTSINGMLLIIDTIKKLATDELSESNPVIYFNFDMLNDDLNTFFEKIFILNSDRLNMQSIVTFSLNDSVKKINSSKFINLLPFLMHGYSAYYTLNQSDISENIALLYPYYMATSSTVILVSADYGSAVVLHDSDIAAAFRTDFEAGTKKCSLMNFKRMGLADMPDVLQSTVEEEAVSALLGIDDGMCTLPFLSKTQFEQIFGQLVPDKAKDALSTKITDYYKKLSDSKIKMTFFSPVDALYSFIDTGIGGAFGFPLPYEERVKLLKKIRRAASTSLCTYNLYDKSRFPWPDGFIFDVISRTEIVFYNVKRNDSDEAAFYVLKIPEYLLQELVDFFSDVSKTCYIYPEEQALKEFDKAIKYAESKLNQ